MDAWRMRRRSTRRRMRRRIYPSFESDGEQEEEEVEKEEHSHGRSVSTELVRMMPPPAFSPLLSYK